VLNAALVTKNRPRQIEQNEDLLAKITTGVAIPVALALLIWTLLITVTAFTGGQAPFFLLTLTEPTLFRGLVWLIVVDPIVLTVAYWIFMSRYVASGSNHCSRVKMKK